MEMFARHCRRKDRMCDAMLDKSELCVTETCGRFRLTTLTVYGGLHFSVSAVNASTGPLFPIKLETLALSHCISRNNAIKDGVGYDKCSRISSYSCLVLHTRFLAGSQQALYVQRRRCFGKPHKNWVHHSSPFSVPAILL